MEESLMKFKNSGIKRWMLKDINEDITGGKGHAV